MVQVHDSPGMNVSDLDAGPGVVAVVGAGAAGMAAALSAARSGARVLLIERAARPGGTVAEALIHTLAGLYDGSGQLLQHGLGEELTERLSNRDPTVRRRRMGRLWVLTASPALYRTVVEEWIASEGNITLLTGSRVSGVTCHGDRVTSLEIVGRHDARLRTGAVVERHGGRGTGAIDRRRPSAR